MCFRPAGVDQFIECSSCGKQINMVMGVAPEECPFCGAKTDGMEKRISGCRSCRPRCAWDSGGAQASGGSRDAELIKASLVFPGGISASLKRNGSGRHALGGEKYGGCIKGKERI